LSDFNESSIFLADISKKCPNIKFHENPSSESRVVPCGQTDGQIRRDTDNNRSSKFANAPKN